MQKIFVCAALVIFSICLWVSKSSTTKCYRNPESEGKKATNEIHRVHFYQFKMALKWTTITASLALTALVLSGCTGLDFGSHEPKSDKDVSTPAADKYWPPPPMMEVPLPSRERLKAAGLPPPPPFFVPPPSKSIKAKVKISKPVQFAKRKLDGVTFYVTTVDMTDPETFISILLPHDVDLANTATIDHGAEIFDSYVAQHHGAVMLNGTFFSKDKQQRVMGNLVAGGKFMKYSQWENYGTTLGIKTGNDLEMVTARAEGQPHWEQHWFSLTCGPRLLRNGEVWVYPDIEGFTDSHVLTIGPRQAIGFSQSRETLYLVSFITSLSLERAGKLMKKIGCYEAMNLDSGASRALAHNDSILIHAGRPLTNVIIVYDKLHPAPQALVKSWQKFQITGKVESH